MEIRVTPELESVLRYAREEAMRTGHYGIGTDHLMLGILRLSDNRITAALTELGVDPLELKAFLDAALSREKPVPWANADLTGFTKGADGALNLSVYESLKWEQSDTGPEHLLLAICRTERCRTKAYLEEHGVNYGILQEYLKRRGSLAPAEDDVMPKAEEIAKAIEEELNKVLGMFPVKSQEIYS